nr:MAG TPA: hypothetical protein [Caudoviricetes sp.]
MNLIVFQYLFSFCLNSFHFKIFYTYNYKQYCS